MQGDHNLFQQSEGLSELIQTRYSCYLWGRGYFYSLQSAVMLNATSVQWDRVACEHQLVLKPKFTLITFR